MRNCVIAQSGVFARFRPVTFYVLRFTNYASPMQNALNYLKENEPRFVRELCEYLRFPSVSAQSQRRADLEAAARWLVEHCRSIGLNARLCPTNGNPVVIAQTPRSRSVS